jgi:hypothetical protein
MKKLFIFSVLIVMAVLAGLVVISNINLQAIKNELRQTQVKIGELEANNKSISTKLANAEKELSVVRSRPADSLKPAVIGNQVLSANNNTPQAKSKSKEFLEALTSGQSVDEKALKLRKLGKLLAKAGKMEKTHGKNPSPEDMQMMSELMRAMAELMSDPVIMDLETMSQSGNEFHMLARPELRSIFSNLIAGLFEGLEQPLTPDQMAQYDSGLARLASMNFGGESQTKIENAIRYLQNAGAIEAEAKRLADIFTPEQKEALMKMKDGNNSVDLDIVPEIGQQYSNSYLPMSNTAKAVESVLSDWSSGTPELQQNESLKPLAEQYLRDYTALRKRLELMYDKNTMDLYLSKNPAVEEKSKESEERAKMLAAPEYKNAKTALDLEFLQLKNQYDKEAAKIIGPEQSEKFNNRPLCLYHFPNLE